MSTNAPAAPAPAEAAPEATFGNKPSAAQVVKLDSVLANLRQNGHLPAVDPQEPTVPAPDPTPTPTAEAPGAPEPAPAIETPAEPAEPNAEDGKRQGWPESAQKRVDKLTAQKKEIEEAKAALEARIAELEARAATPAGPATPEAPAATAEPAPADLFALDSLDAVETRRRELRQMQYALDDFKTTGWEGTDAQGKPLDYTPEEIRAQLQAVRYQLDEALPSIERALRQRDEKVRPVLKERYDWWGKPTDSRHTEAQSLLKALPELRRLPNAELIIANHVAMEHQLKAAATATPAKAPAVKAPAAPAAGDPPPVPTSTPAASSTTRAPAGSVRPSEVDLAAVRAGDPEALAATVSRLLRGHTA